MMSIKDIARLAGVSPSTVSRVINQKKYVKPELRERIMAVVKETGYVPSHAARSMVLKRSFTVGIVIPYAFNMFQRQLFAIIERQLETQAEALMDAGYEQMNAYLERPAPVVAASRARPVAAWWQTMWGRWQAS